MSLYGHSALKESFQRNDLEGVDLQPYIELMAYDDIRRGTDEQISAFCESEVAQVLMEKQVLNKGTMMRLSKADDEKRRIIMVSYRLAKEANDPDYRKMIEYRAKWKEHKRKVLQKFSQKAKRIAIESQKEYIKRAKKEPAAQPTEQK